jgi:hypothetical protein
MRQILGGVRALLFLLEDTMQGIKSPAGKWSVSLCSCSRDTAHFHYGNVVLHISLDDLRELGHAMQCIADRVEHAETDDHPQPKKGLVQ